MFKTNLAQRVVLSLTSSKTILRSYPVKSTSLNSMNMTTAPGSSSLLTASIRQIVSDPEKPNNSHLNNFTDDPTGIALRIYFMTVYSNFLCCQHREHK